MLDGWPIDSPSRALADVEDMLGLLVTWPTWARELILKKGLSNEERNTLTWFTLGNRLPPLTRTGTRVDAEMEIQGCDEYCDTLCVRSCSFEWDPCVVIADHGTYCDVRMSDGAMIAGVVNRFLRWPALPGVSKRARRNLSGEVLV